MEYRTSLAMLSLKHSSQALSKHLQPKPRPSIQHPVQNRKSRRNGYIGIFHHPRNNPDAQTTDRKCTNTSKAPSMSSSRRIRNAEIGSISRRSGHSWQKRKTRLYALRLDQDFQNEVAVFVNGFTRGLKGVSSGAKPFESMSYHVVQTGQNPRGDNLDTNGIRVCVAENANNIDLLQMGGRHG